MKCYIKFLPFCALLLLSCNATSAQTTKFFSIDQGLSNSLINQVYQDKKGFIWVATENGLNKFDGNKFTVYRKIPGDATSLNNNQIQTMLEDSSGNFWLRALGLMKYNRDFDTFQEVFIRDESGKRIYPPITSICERKNGDVWFASSGIGLFSVKKGEAECKLEAPLNKRLSSLFLTVVYEDSNNRLWIGSDNSGLNVYSFDTDQLHIYTASSDGKNRITSDAISAICEDGNGSVFVGTLDGGLNKFEASGMSITPVHGRDGNRHISIKTLLFDRAGRLYAGTDGNGIKIYNPEKQTLEPYEPFSSPFDFHKAKVHSLMEDKDGNIWAGIFQKGVFFIPANPNGFRYLGYKSFTKNSIGTNCIMAIYKDRYGVTWVGTDNDGLYALHGQEVRHYENTDLPSSAPSTILCIRETSDGKLWLGSYLNGVALLDRQTGACRYINTKTDNTLSSNKIYCMADDKKGGLWIGTHSGGLYKYDVALQSFTARHFQQQGNEGGLSNNWVNALLYEEEGLLWIGTFSGLNCLNTMTNTLYKYMKETSSLPSNTVFSLKKDRQGKIWIGTDEGLACLNKKTGEIRSYTTHDGLPNNEICAIEEDEAGNIWLSTYSGISCYSPVEDKFTSYYASDGLQGNEFSRGAGFKSTDGEIFFGGINGITSFMPGQIHSKKENLDVYITGFYLLGKPVHKGQKSGKKAILDKPLLEASRLTLSPDDNVFTFEFSTLSYANSEGVSYRYRLENFDAGWMSTPLGANRVAYTNLSSGKYTLLFQAVDKENKSEVKAVEIIIRSPWYNTAAAKIIYVAILLLILYAAYRVISSRVRERDKLLHLEHAERMNESKLQFFTDISHEIRTPMTLIIGPLEKLLMKSDNPELRSAYLLIYRNAQRILRLINQLMDIRKIDRGQMRLKARETDMVGFIKDVMQSFEYLASKKNIDFEFNPDMPSLKVWIDLNNFDKALFNLFSNAFKFTPEGGKISVALKTGSDSAAEGALKSYFEIKIQDTGMGISKEDIHRVFERFYQIDNDVTRSNFGTGIGLHLSRSLIELQQGIIYAENRADCDGSCFVIRMPLGNGHLQKEEMEIIPEQSPLAILSYSKKDDLFDVEAEPDKRPSVSARTKYRILIAENDLETGRYICHELAPLYKVTQIDNGKDALEAILKEKPDLVISDILMPKMDGITLCRKVKSNVNVDHIPVILLTSKSGEEDYAEGLDSGAEACIVKPFNPEILKKTIANILDNRERLKGKAQLQSEGRIDKIEMKSFDEILMEKILKVINDNIKNPNLNVEMLSSSAGMSRVHMHRKLKELTNQSARDFIRTIRLKQAGELLKSKKYSISQVSDAVGFASFTYFSVSFKEFYGVSPREYMETHTDKRSGK
ncbi:MAG: response regulator [Prevotellaceae bacterium]|jgi:signal transduction histidine kinase/ligand-binding sensor domain-containing protein/AraC-like DNA-binding protein|nr:response regulator [Prevotellaceae bacterium]